MYFSFSNLTCVQIVSLNVPMQCLHWSTSIVEIRINVIFLLLFGAYYIQLENAQIHSTFHSIGIFFKLMKWGLGKCTTFIFCITNRFAMSKMALMNATLGLAVQNYCSRSVETFRGNLLVLFVRPNWTHLSKYLLFYSLLFWLYYEHQVLLQSSYFFPSIFFYFKQL